MPVRHHHRKTPVTILAVSIGLALQMGAAAHAQEAAQTTESGQTTPAEGTVDTLDTVSVTGYRASVERALDIKRGEAGVVDAIVAEDIGKFPDQNLAESLQRIPGVVITRDAGEGRVRCGHAADAWQSRAPASHPHAPLRGKPGASAILDADCVGICGQRCGCDHTR
mgnify:CR=1 FL=1